MKKALSFLLTVLFICNIALPAGADNVADTVDSIENIEELSPITENYYQNEQSRSLGYHSDPNSSVRIPVFYGLAFKEDKQFLMPGESVQLELGMITEPLGVPYHTEMVAAESVCSDESQKNHDKPDSNDFSKTEAQEGIVDNDILSAEDSDILSEEDLDNEGSIVNGETIAVTSYSEESDTNSKDAETTVLETENSGTDLFYVPSTESELPDESAQSEALGHVGTNEVPQFVEVVVGEQDHIDKNALTIITEAQYESLDLIWSSSNEAVVGIGLNGLVEARSLGTAVVEVSTCDGQYSAKCEIHVVKTKPEAEKTNRSGYEYNVALSPNTSWADKPGHWAVRLQDTFSVNFDVYMCDDNGNYTGVGGDLNGSMNWSSSNTAVATVDIYGRVTGHANGSATITVTAKNGDNIYVFNPIHITVYTPYSSTHTGIVNQNWVTQYKCTVSNCHLDRQIQVISPGTKLDIYGSSGGYVYGKIQNKTQKGFMWAGNVYDQTANGSITICRSSDSDTRRHWDVYTTGVLTFKLTNNASATWTTLYPNIIRVGSGSSYTGSTVTITALAEGSAYLTATTSSGKIDVIHITTITKFDTELGITINWCSKYKCSHTECTIIDRMEGDTQPNKLVNIYGESDGFYYANVAGENTYRYMWKGNVALNTWSRMRELQNTVASPKYLTQGFAVDTNYAYSFEVRGTDGTNDEHRLFRYNINTGERIKMTNYQNSVSDLWHANDAAIVSFNENGVTKKYIFVAAYSDLMTNYIVKLGFDSSGSYWEVARYTVGNNIRFAGLTLLSGGGNNSAVLLLYNGDYYYSVVVGKYASSGNLTPSYRFQIVHACDLGDDPDANTRQGIHYEQSNDTLYVAFWNNTSKNRNVIRAYSNITTASGTVYPSDYWIIKKGSDEDLHFEVEGVGFRPNSSDTRPWFNTFEGDTENGGIYTDRQLMK